MRPISACDFPALSSLAILSRNSLSTFLPRGMLCAPKYTAMIADRLSCPRGGYHCLVFPTHVSFPRFCLNLHSHFGCSRRPFVRQMRQKQVACCLREDG